MNSFNKRPLGLILCIMLGGFSVYALISGYLALAAMILSFLFCVLTLFVKALSSRIIRISAFALLVSFLLSFFYFNYIFYPTQYYGEEVSITGKVKDIEEIYDYAYSIDLDVDEIEGRNADYRFKLTLYGDYDDLKVGSVISLKTTVDEFETSGEFNFKTYYSSRGFSASCDTSEILLIKYEEAPLSYKVKLIRSDIIERAVAISDEFSGTLLSALLIGEKDLLSGQLLLDFQRIGISHMLALSGLHVAILMGALEMLLRLFRVRKYPRIIIECVATLLFMMLTGFPLSVTRAGAMLVISSILFLLSGNKDSITSLFIAGALIFLINPYSALDIGLWLSIIATFGILVSGDFLNQKYDDTKGIKRIPGIILTSLLFSLFAISASSIVSALSFSGTSVISAFSTLIFSFIIELYICFGIIALIFGDVIPLGNLLIKFSDFISSLASKISDIPNIYGSLNFTIVKISFIALCVLFVIFAVAKIDKKRRFIALIALCYVFVSVLNVSLTALSKDDDIFVAYSDTGDKILIKSSGKSMLFDSSSHRSGDAYHSNYVLRSENIVELDYYLVANYTTHIAESLNIILKNTKVNEVLLPIPRDESEDEIAAECFKIIDSYRTTVEFYSDDEVVSVGEYEILVPHRAYYKKSYAFTFKRDDEIYSYLSSGVLENTPFSEELLYVSKRIIFGNYGETYSYNYIIDEFDKKIDYIAIFDSKLTIDIEEDLKDATSVSYNLTRCVLFD